MLCVSVLLLSILGGVIEPPPAAPRNDSATTVSGLVVAPDGSALASASVVFVDRTTGERVSVVTGSDGIFIASVHPGRFDVRVELAGFEPEMAELQVDRGAAIVHDFVLAVGRYVEHLDVIGSTPRSIVTTAELGETTAHDVGEAIARTAGLSTVRKGGIANDVVLRGYQGENLTVMIDGARLHGACPSNMDPVAFHADLAEVERVDVARGPFDMRTQGGLGGVLNIVTSRPQRGFHALLNLAGGSAGYVNPSATVSYGSGGTSILGGFSFRRSSPYEDGAGRPFTTYTNFRPDLRDSAAFDAGTGWVRGYAAPSSGRSVQVAYTRQHADHVLYPYLQMDGISDTANRLNGTFEVTSPFPHVESLSVQGYYSRVRHFMTDQYRTSSAGAPRGYAMGTDAATDTFGAKLVAAAAGWQAGFEGYRRNWSTESWMASNGYRPQYALPNAFVVSAGGYVEGSRTVGAVRTEVGARLDWTRSAADPALANLLLYQAYAGTQSTERSDVYPSAKARVVVAATEELSIEAGVAHGVRTPDPQERYYAASRMGSDWVGDPNLDPSRNTEIAAGARFNHGRLRVDATAFADFVAGFVAVADVKLPARVPGTMNTQGRSYANVDARIRGGEATLDYALGSAVFASASVAYTRGTKSPLVARGITTPDLAEIPPFSGRMSVRYDRGAWFAEASGTFALAQDHVDTDLNEQPTPGWAIAGLRGGFRFAHLRVSAAIDNLLNADYAAHLSYQRDPYRAGVIVHEPGRTLSIRTTAAW